MLVNKVPYSIRLLQIMESKAIQNEIFTNMLRSDQKCPASSVCHPQLACLQTERSD